MPYPGLRSSWFSGLKYFFLAKPVLSSSKGRKTAKEYSCNDIVSCNKYIFHLCVLCAFAYFALSDLYNNGDDLQADQWSD